jgi:hypothetical protein
MQQRAELTAAGYRAVRSPRVRWFYDARLLSSSLPVEGDHLQAESPVIGIKLVDLVAEQVDLGIHYIRQALGAVSGCIIGNVRPRAAGVWRCTYLWGWHNGRPGIA